MSRYLRFSALRRSFLRATDAVATNVRSEHCRYQVRHLLFIWGIIFVFLLALVIFSLAVFTYLVPCPVWRAGSGPLARSRQVARSNSSNHFNSSTLTYFDENFIDVNLSTSSPPSSFLFINDLYTWKCPFQSLYFVQEEYTTTTSPVNETTFSQRISPLWKGRKSSEERKRANVDSDSATTRQLVKCFA